MLWQRRKWLDDRSRSRSAQRWCHWLWGSDIINKGMVKWTNMSVINRPIKNSKLAETMRTLRKCKINFNKPLVLTINNLLKPLLSKPETKLIQRKYETILHCHLFEMDWHPWRCSKNVFWKPRHVRGHIRSHICFDKNWTLENEFEKRLGIKRGHF